jgi:hypothetical protein
VGTAQGAFVAFYVDLGKARRLASVVARDANRLAGEIERRGAVTILWVHPPAREQRRAVEACLPGR